MATCRPCKIVPFFSDLSLSYQIINATEDTEATAIADEYILNLSEDNLLVFIDGSKYEKGEVCAGVVKPHWNSTKEFKITNDTTKCT